LLHLFSTKIAFALVTVFKADIDQDFGDASLHRGIIFYLKMTDWLNFARSWFTGHS